MLGNFARTVLGAVALAGCISGWCSPVMANTPAVHDSAASVPAIELVRPAPDRLQLAQTDLALPSTADDMQDTAVTEAVEMPVVATRLPPVRIALLLPRRSESLAQVADAVRAGFMAAHQYEPANITVSMMETGDAAQDVLSGYLEAAASNDIVVGPLTRSGAAAIVQHGMISRPTIVLTQLDAGDVKIAVPANMLVMGLSIEDEARQIARWTAQGATTRAFAISTNASWQRRAVKAFSTQWRAPGFTAETMELAMTGSFINAAALVQLKRRIQTEKPAIIFVALDAAQTMQLRLAIGSEVPMVGTSQLNPLAHADWETADKLLDLEGVRLLDVPWQLQPDHAAVMAYPQLQKAPGQRSSSDLQRLYALGIDAYRVAHNIAIRQNDFNLDGVTGKLTVHFGHGPSTFDRVMQSAVYRDGVVQALDTP